MALPRALSFIPSVSGAAFLASYYLKNHSWPCFDKGLLGFILAFITLATLSSFWSPDVGYALSRSWKIAAILVSAFGLFTAASTIPSPVPNSNRILIFLTLCCALAASVFFFEYQSRFLITRFLLGMDPKNLPDSIRSGFFLNRSLVFLILLCIPITLGMHISNINYRTKCLLCIVLFVSLGMALLSTKSQTAQVATMLAILMLFYPAHRKKARVALMVGVLFAMLAAPFFAPPVYKEFFSTEISHEQDGFLREASVPHRLEVWKFVSEQIANKPIFGNGLEAIRFLKAGYIMPNMKTDHVLHPHNAVLQIWVEFGMVGAILMMAFTVFLLRKLEHQTPLMQRYYTMLFVVLLGILVTGYGLWQPWLLGMTMVLPAFSMMVEKIYKQSP